MFSSQNTNSPKSVDSSSAQKSNTSKNITPTQSGSTIAQKRLEKLRQDLKGRKKAEENVYGSKSYDSNKKGETFKSNSSPSDSKKQKFTSHQKNETPKLGETTFLQKKNISPSKLGRRLTKYSYPTIERKKTSVYNQDDTSRLSNEIPRLSNKDNLCRKPVSIQEKIIEPTATLESGGRLTKYPSSSEHNKEKSFVFKQDETAKLSDETSRLSNRTSSWRESPLIQKKIVEMPTAKLGPGKTTVQARLEKFKTAKQDRNKKVSPSKGSITKQSLENLKNWNSKNLRLPFLTENKNVGTHLNSPKTRKDDKYDVNKSNNRLESPSNKIKRDPCKQLDKSYKIKSPITQNNVNNTLSMILPKRKSSTGNTSPELKRKKLKGIELKQNDMEKNEQGSFTKMQDSDHRNRYDEDMDWEVTVDDVTVHLQEVRNTVNNEQNIVEMMDWQDSPLEINSIPKNNIIHYVVDTNIFISSLKLIKKLTDCSNEDLENIIVIPWQVLKELDCLKIKPTQNISSAARRAVSYLLECTTCHTSKVVWQTQKQDAEECQNFFVEIPDDHIIKCCIQLISSGHNVVLLSNDKNLRLKALTNQITSISDDKLLEKLALNSYTPTVKHALEEMPEKSVELEIYGHRLAKVFNKFLNNVIKQYLRQIYGNMWLWHISAKPPLSLNVSLKLLRNYASDIFKTDSYKSYLNSIAAFFKQETYSTLSYFKIDRFARKCLKLAKLIGSSANYYILDVEQFENDLAFLKSRESAVVIPFDDLCCKLTIDHFQILESTVVGYCYKLAETTGVSIIDPVLYERKSVEPKDFHTKQIPEYIKSINTLLKNTERLSKIPSGQVSAHTRGIVSVYEVLKTYVEDADPMFTVEDIVLFFNNENIRNGFPEAVSLFNSLLIYLRNVQKRLNR